MLRYAYEVKQANGELQRGMMEAESAQVVERRLTAQGYQILSLQPVIPPVVEKPWAPLFRRVVQPILYPVGAKQVAQFFTSLRVLLSAGMTMAEAMTTLSRQTRNATLKQVAREAAEAAAHGRPMSSVLRRYPGAFSSATMAAVQAAEQSGMVEKTADLLSKFYDRAYQLALTYRWQTFYPKILLVCALLIPTLQTLVLGTFSAWASLVMQRTLPLLALIVVLWYGWRALVRIPGVGRAIDGIKLLIPWFGSLSRRISTAHWARALAMLSSAGVPIHQAAVAAAAASGNKAMEASLVREARGLLDGHSMSEVIKASREIPQAALDLVTVAEKSGSIEDALDKIAEYYEAETEVGGKQTAMAVGVLAYLAIAAVIAFIVIRAWGGYFAGVSDAIDQSGQ
jgi:type II secretory pathway component PulF